MRLYGSKVQPIAAEIVRSLTAAKDIEAESPREVEADVQSVLNNYLTTEREVNDKTRDLLQRTGRGQTEFNRVRAQIAETKGIKVGDEMLDYLLDQVVAMFHNSPYVDEIYSEDVDMRRKMAGIFKRHLAAEEQLDAEVRAQLKHLTEGTRTWEIEYQKVLEQARRKHGLS